MHRMFTDRSETCHYYTKFMLLTFTHIQVNFKSRDWRSKTSEKVIDITPEAKSIRMDVYLDDDENTVYDLEMQTSSKKNLPKRLRYYQGVIDLNLIEKGDDYDQLPESVIVFICTFDYFDKNLPFYVFENRCEAMPELLLGDETKKIFVNPYGKRDDLPEDVVYFLDYIRDQKAEDDFTRQLDQAVVKARIHGAWIQRMLLINWKAIWSRFRSCIILWILPGLLTWILFTTNWWIRTCLYNDCTK